MQTLSLIITFSTPREVHDLWRSILDALVYILVSAILFVKKLLRFFNNILAYKSILE